MEIEREKELGEIQCIGDGWSFANELEMFEITPFNVFSEGTFAVG